MDALRLFVGAALTVGLACGGAPRGPVETVDRYFEMLAQDPMRTLDLLTPGFHRSHGLPPWRLEDRRELRASESPQRPAPSPAVATENGIVGWLAGQITPEVIERAKQLRFQVEETTIGEAEAEVWVAVQPPRASAFRQRFELVRTDGAWRIDRIAQEGGGVGAWNDLARYVAYPNEATARRLREYPRADR